MTTPTEVTKQLIQELMDNGILTLLDPKTREPVGIDDGPTINLINSLTKETLPVILPINAHRPIE